MKNKKGNTAVIAVIIVIVAITAGVVGWMFAKKSQVSAQQEVAIKKPAPSQESQPEKVQVEQQPVKANVSSESSRKVVTGSKYINDKYGFEIEITRSKIWNNLSVRETTIREIWTKALPEKFKYKPTPGDEDPVFQFEIPTSDKEWESGLGYFSPFSIYVWSLDSWNKMHEDGPSLNNIMIKKTAKYVFAYGVGGQQDRPSDFQNTDFEISNIISTFKLTN